MLELIFVVFVAGQCRNGNYD